MRCLDSQLKNQHSRYLSKKCQIDRSKIEKIDEHMFLVPSERHYREYNKMYMVNMNLSVCECLVGMLHGPCKHKQIVAEHFIIASPDIIRYTVQLESLKGFLNDLDHCYQKLIYRLFSQQTYHNF